MSWLQDLEQNKTLKEFGAKLGFGKSSAQKAAEENLAQSKQAYEGLEPPELTPIRADLAEASDQGPSAFENINISPEYRAAQVEQLAALRNLAANGGRNAASDANLARIRQGEMAAAKGQRDAILQNAYARGMGRSGADLIAQLSSSQNAMNNQSQQDMDVLGQQQNTALQAAQGAANIGGNLENSAYQQQANKAAAADAIARFNAGQRTGINQSNTNALNQAQQFNSGLQQTGYQNKFQKAAGLSGANMGGLNYNQAQAALGAQQAGNILGSTIQLGAAAAKGAAAAHGGYIPGMAKVPGDSKMNDTVPITASPGEVVVPRSIVQHGAPHEIVNFVKHPPQVKLHQGGNDREAMLSALKNLRRRG